MADITTPLPQDTKRLSVQGLSDLKLGVLEQW